MERAQVSCKLKGDLARKYKQLDEKSYHVRKALREYFRRRKQS